MVDLEQESAFGFGENFNGEYIPASELDATPIDNLGFDLPTVEEQEADQGYDDQLAEEGDHFDDTLDHEADQKAIKDSLPPAGSYEVEDLQSNYEEVKEKLATKQKNKETITYKDRHISYFGMGFREIAGREVPARIRFRLCHVKEYKEQEDPEEPAKLQWAYRMYLQAKKAYTVAYGEAPTSFTQIDDYLTSSAVKKVRITQTDDDILPVGISGVRVA